MPLNDQEKAYLENRLDSDLRETRVEVRRAMEPNFRDELRKREDLIRGLLERLRGDKPPEGGSPRA